MFARLCTRQELADWTTIFLYSIFVRQQEVAKVDISAHRGAEQHECYKQKLIHPLPSHRNLIESLLTFSACRCLAGSCRVCCRPSWAEQESQLNRLTAETSPSRCRRDLILSDTGTYRQITTKYHNYPEYMYCNVRMIRPDVNVIRFTWPVIITGDQKIKKI